MKQIVVVLFLLAVFEPLAASSEELRLEASVEAMGSTYSLVLYGEDRSRLEADELDQLFPHRFRYSEDSTFVHFGCRLPVTGCRQNPVIAARIGCCR